MRVNTESESILGATLLSSCSIARVSFHLEDGLPPCILVCFKGAFAPVRVWWPDFQKIVEKFRAGRNRVRTMDSEIPSGPLWKNTPKEKTWRVSARFLDRGEIRCQWGDTVTTLSPTDFSTLVDMIITAQNKALLLISRRQQKAELVGKPTLRQRFPTTPRMGFFALLFLDGVLFIAMFFAPGLVWAFLFCAIMTGALISRSPDHLATVTRSFRPHANSHLLNEIGKIHIPRRVLEIFAVLFFGFLYYAVFGSEVISVIMSSFKRILGIE